MPTVTLLMATHNGARYLPAQLGSLAAQTHSDWRLWVGDDGSSDATRALIGAFARAHPDREVRLFDGPCRGSAANFLALLCHADLPAGPVAFCDQDDVWLDGKLARALRRLDSLPDGPALYAAESFLTDARLAPFARSRSGPRKPGFANALVQNLCSGHTMLLNTEAVVLARRAGPQPGVLFHDWWLYQLATGAGGACHLDPLPVALYRQHAGNAVGAGCGPAAMARRLRGLVRGDFAHWLAAHHAALRGVGPLLTPGARALLAELDRTPSGPARAAAFRRLGLSRDAPAATAALWSAAALGRA